MPMHTLVENQQSVGEIPDPYVNTYWLFWSWEAAMNSRNGEALYWSCLHARNRFVTIKRKNLSEKQQWIKGRGEINILTKKKAQSFKDSESKLRFIHHKMSVH